MQILVSPHPLSDFLKFIVKLSIKGFSSQISENSVIKFPFLM